MGASSISRYEFFDPLDFQTPDEAPLRDFNIVKATPPNHGMISTASLVSSPYLRDSAFDICLEIDIGFGELLVVWRFYRIRSVDAMDCELLNLASELGSHRSLLYVAFPKQ